MNKQTGRKYWWLLLLLLLIAVNFLAYSFHERIDLTKEKRYTLNKTTRQLLFNLDDVITIDVFLKGEFPSGFKKLANSTEDFLKTIKDYNTSKINYRFIAPEEQFENSSIKYGDTLIGLGATPINLSVQIKGGQQQKFVFPVALISYNGKQKLVSLYGGSSRTITQVEINNAEASLEYKFVKVFEDLVTNAKALVGYSIGNGEPSFSDAKTFDLYQTVRRDFAFFTLDLNNHPFIPDTFRVLIVVKPSIQFTDAEKVKIDQFLMRGGSLLFFIDGLFAEQDSLQYKPETIAFDRNLNLADLLFRYGIRINPDLVMDLQCDFMPFAVGGTNDNPQFEFLKWNYYPLFESKNNHLINKNLGLIAGRFVNSIDTIKTRGITKTILLSSSENTRTITTPALISLNENKIEEVHDAFSKSNVPVGILLEGAFTSLYRNRISKTQMDTLALMGVPFRESSVAGKMILVADGDMILNDVSVKEGPLPMGLNLYTAGSQYEYQFANRDFLLNCLEYLTDKPGIIALRNKDIALRLLDSKKVNAQKTTWQLINIGVPILLILLFGIIYQQVRKKKYTSY